MPLSQREWEMGGPDYDPITSLYMGALPPKIVYESWFYLCSMHWIVNEMGVHNRISRVHFGAKSAQLGTTKENKHCGRGRGGCPSQNSY